MIKTNKLLAVIWFLMLILQCNNVNADGILRAYVTNSDSSSVTTYNIELSGPLAGNIEKIGADTFVGGGPSQIVLNNSSTRAYIVEQGSDVVPTLNLDESGLFISGSLSTFYFNYYGMGINSIIFDSHGSPNLLTDAKIFICVIDYSSFEPIKSVSIGGWPFSLNFIRYEDIEYAIITSSPNKMTLRNVDSFTDPGPWEQIATGNNPQEVKINSINNSIYVLCEGIYNNEIWIYRLIGDQIVFERKIDLPSMGEDKSHMEVIPARNSTQKTLLYVIKGPKIIVYEDNQETHSIKLVQAMTSKELSAPFSAIAVNPIVDGAPISQPRYVYITQLGTNQIIGFKVTTDTHGQYGVLSEQSSAPTGYNPSSITLQMF